MDAQVVVALIAAVGVGPAVATLVSGAVQHWTGRAERERTAIVDARERELTAQTLLDQERRYRRAAEDWAELVADHARAHGVTDLPPRPY